MDRLAFIEQVGRLLEIESPSEGTLLVGDDRWDSLGQVDVMMLIEQELGLTVSADDLREAKSIQDLVRLVETRLAR